MSGGKQDMEAQRFDELTRELARPVSRGRALKVALASALGGMLGMRRVSTAGAATSRCPSGTTLCNGQCVPNVTSSEGMACNGTCCAAGTVCVGGACVTNACCSPTGCTTCTPGKLCINGACAIVC